MMRKLTKVAVRVLESFSAKIQRRPEQDPEHLVMGRRGEDAAYFHLRQLGYVIVARNWRSRRRKGEIDLIGMDGDVLCFIEVKTRGTREVKPAEAAVDREKRRELIAMAREYLWRKTRTSGNGPAKPATGQLRGSSHSVNSRVCRFDVISVYYEAEQSEPTEIALFRNSFPMS